MLSDEIKAKALKVDRSKRGYVFILPRFRLDHEAVAGKRMRAASRPAAGVSAEEKNGADDARTDSNENRAGCWLAGLTKGVRAWNLSVKESERGGGRSDGGVKTKVQTVLRLMRSRPKKVAGGQRRDTMVGDRIVKGAGTGEGV